MNSFISKENFLVTYLFFIVQFYSCTKDLPTDFNESIVDDPYSSELLNLTIPDGFDFSTHKEVEIVINDDRMNVRYDVFGYTEERIYLGDETFENEEGDIVTEPLYKSEMLQNLLFSGAPYKGSIVQKISVPNHIKELYIRSVENLNYASSIIPISNNKVSYTYARSDFKTNESLDLHKNQQLVVDLLYCVNGSAELFQVDPLTGAYTYISDMPMGSWTCAIDQENMNLYSIGRSSPYPLMKYSIENNTWETIANIGKGGPRLDYNSVDGLLYFSTGDKLYSYNPTNGEAINTWTINGLHNTSGGDLAFDENGILYLCTFSGLYRLSLDSNNVYQSTRISADNLPFNPTSMTFDSNKELWLANNASSSDLIIMDTETGGWKYNFGLNANNGTDFGRTINDLTTFRIFTEIQDDPDTDGDGIVDRNDEYPNDANKAFESFTPSKYGWGTIAFEDLWPVNGDYDFNDLALNYRIIAILNSENLVVQLDFIINVKSNRASYTNGFGIEFESLIPSQISSVIGTDLRHNIINVAENGTELGQENAVIILFDDSNTVFNSESTISVILEQPITTNELGIAPFNPFLIINKVREKEVHLPFKQATSLGINEVVVNGMNSDKDGDYTNDNGLPWAINIVHDFKVPKEKIAINSAYNYFTQWAISGGAQYNDWYKDNPGYRNSENIEN